MRANKTLLQMKYARTVALYAQAQNVSLAQALEIFYTSQLYELVRQGISDLHCMSDAYLVEELELEQNKN